MLINPFHAQVALQNYPFEFNFEERNRSFDRLRMNIQVAQPHHLLTQVLVDRDVRTHEQLVEFYVEINQELCRNVTDKRARRIHDWFLKHQNSMFFWFFALVLGFLTWVTLAGISFIVGAVYFLTSDGLEFSGYGFRFHIDARASEAVLSFQRQLHASYTDYFRTIEFINIDKARFINTICFFEPSVVGRPVL